MDTAAAKASKPKKQRKKGRIKQFFREIWGEVKKLSWLTKKDLARYVLTVLAFIVLMSVFIYACDLLFGQGMTLLGNL